MDAVTAVVLLSAGCLIAIGLVVVFIVITVRHQGWGRRTSVPHARPWFVASSIVLVITLIGGIAWAVL